MNARFLLGAISVDDDVKQALGRVPLDLVARHAILDNGLISARRRKLNAIAMAEGDEIVSEYLADPTDPKGPHIRITTASGWGRTDVTLIKPQPNKDPPHEPPV